jgi:transcriptional regulator with XRE-family HTH domain
VISGNDLRTARVSRGVSLGQLARLIGRDKGHLSRVETGAGRQVTPALVRDYERALGIAVSAGGGDLAIDTSDAISAYPLQELSRPSPRGTTNDEDDAATQDASSVAELVSALAREDLGLDRREATRTLAGMLVGAALLERVERWLGASEPPTASRRTAGVGYQEIEQIEHAAQIFRKWDHQFGGGLRRKAVVGQLTEVADELRDFSHPADLTRRLHGSMAQLAQTAATMSWDSGQGGVAQQYYLLALRSARAAGDPAFCANTLADMARQQFYLGHVAEGLELVRLAQDCADGRLTPAVRAMLSTREAWAYAKQGRLAAFHRATSRAEDHLRDLDPAAEPHWISYFDQAELAGVTGGRLLEAAHLSPRHAEDAAAWLRQAVELRDGNSLRSTALDQIGFAEVRLVQGEHDEAARLGNEALTTVEQTHSSRVRVKLTEFYRHTGARRSTPSIAELRARIKPVLSAAPAT